MEDTTTTNTSATASTDADADADADAALDTAAAVATFNETLRLIQPQLRIRLVYLDDDIILIDKPCNLRSVPGNLYPPSQTPDRKRLHPNNETSTRMTSQQAWETAIRCFSLPDGCSNSSLDMKRISPTITSCLKQLSATDTLVASIPRKWKPFLSYVHRNRKRILMTDDLDDPTFHHDCSKQLEDVAHQLHRILQQRQQQLMNIPQSTQDEESAYGQLKIFLTASLIANGKDEHTLTGNNPPLYIVHRLDCETSGVMVFARTQTAASKLGRAWRERDCVSKTYWAKVNCWPPYNQGCKREGREELPLAPSEERLKWKVVPHTDPKGKMSLTEWKVLGKDTSSDTVLRSSGSEKVGDGLIGQKEQETAKPVTLELRPITGRTHQLRIVCAHVGSGILGDSLYGEEPLERLGSGGKRLLLHAQKLSFVHPSCKEVCVFTSTPDWHT